MNVSTRNQFPGTVRTLQSGPVNAELVIDIGGGVSIISIITNSSAERLGLKMGKEVIALIKASSVILTSESKDKTSARNELCGKVVRCKEGAVNTEVGIELTGGAVLTSIITNESAHRLGIREMAKACALFKASSVIIAVKA